MQLSLELHRSAHEESWFGGDDSWLEGGNLWAEGGDSYLDHSLSELKTELQREMDAYAGLRKLFDESDSSFEITVGQVRPAESEERDDESLAGLLAAEKERSLQFERFLIEQTCSGNKSHNLIEANPV